MPATTTIARIIAALCIVVAVPAMGAEYYVSNSGSDGNSGSLSAPWATLQKAANSVGAGDVVHVANGTYTGFQVTADGTPSSPITFVADGSNVILNQQNSSTPDIVNIEFADYIIVDGFAVEDSPRIGIRAVRSTGVIIRNNVVARSGLTGILSGWTPFIQVIGNVCSASILEHGIYVSNSDVVDDNPVIRDNVVFGNAKNGVQVNGDCWEGGDGIIKGALIEGNFVHDNNWKGFSLISMQNSLVRNNVIYDNGVSAGAGGIHLTDQVGPSCDKPSSNNMVVNNTIVEPRIACIRITDGSVGNVIFNNLCVASSSSYLIADEVGGNIIDGSNLTLLSSVGLFENEGAKNYHLGTSSAAVDAGVASVSGLNAPNVDRDGNARPAGGGFDVGAYESGSTGAVDTTPPSGTVASPADQSTITQVATISASVTDDVGVVGVQFRVDGAPYAAEDVSSPYSTSFDPMDFANGSHTVNFTARDAAGNIGTSPTITIFVNNAPVQAGIPTTHPRMWVHAGWLQDLRANACLDANGNTIPGCTPTNFWDTFIDFVNTSSKADAWHYALAFQVTGNTSWATQAISKADGQVSCDYTCIANSNNKFLYVRDYMRDVALVYDWCYDQLSSQQKADYINYMNKMMFITWNDNPEAKAIFDTGDWATSNPKQNYYYNYLLALTYVSVATYHENPGTFTHGGTQHTLYLLMDSRDESSERFFDPYDFLLAKLSQQAFPTLDTLGKGGGWLEGENYGRAMKRHLAEAFCILQETAGLDFFNDPSHPFMREVVRYQFHTVQPGGGILYPGGDASAEPTLRTNPYDRHLMLLAARGLEGSIEGQYAQYWCNHDLTQMSGISEMIPVDFFLDDPALPERNYNELPVRYTSEGMGWVNSRSGWDDNAVSVTFTSNDRIQGHQHSDQNHFTIFVGGQGSPVDGWMITDCQPYSSTLPRSSDWHNTYLMANTSQRFENGTGEMIKYEPAPTYTYAVGDASDAYWTNPGGYSHGDEKITDVFQRELVHVLPGYVVTFDRISLTSAFATSPVECLFHYPYVQPAISGNLYTTTNAAARVFHRVLLPASYSVNWVDDDTAAGSDRMDTWRMELTDNVTKPNYQFLNVFHATSSSVSSTPDALLVNSNDGNMTGTVIKDPAQEQVIMFSKDPSGAAPVGDIIYEVGVRLDSRHHLFNLLPGMGYAIEVSGNDDNRTIRVAQGGEWTASAAGSLVFTLEEVVSRTVPVATAR